jgi:hypothetical protein
MGCKGMDVAKCSESVMSVGVKLAAKVISDPLILINWGEETMEFAKCMSEKFEMVLPIENLASSKTSEMKEALTTKCSSNSDCKPPLKCLNGKCDITTALKTVKETEEMNEVPFCPRGWTYCATTNKCCPPDSFCDGSQGCRSRQFGKVPGMPPMNESDEIIYEIEMDEEEMDEGNDFGKRKYNRRGDQREEEMKEEPGELGCCRNSAKPCGPGYYCKCPSGICSKIMPVRV